MTPSTVRREAHVFLVRHGRTPLNAAGQLRGHLDPPLDDVGHLEAYALAAAIAYCHPVRILTSPLFRAVQTAEPLSHRTRVQVQVESRLIDRDYGDWAGHKQAEVVAQWGAIDRAPGVEASSAVLERARAVLDDQIPYIDDGPVVLVSHDVVNRLLLTSIDPTLGEPDAVGQRTGCWNVLLRTGNGWRVEQVDQRPDVDRLPSALRDVEREPDDCDQDTHDHDCNDPSQPVSGHRTRTSGVEAAQRDHWPDFRRW